MDKIKNINYLLKKYSTYVPGEKRTPEYDNMKRQQRILHDNIQLLHELNNELPINLQLNRCDIRIAETLAKLFHGNLKTLCRNCKKELIYLVFIFYLKKMENPSLQIEEEPVLIEKGLNTQIYTLIISRTLKYYMEHVPIPITTTTDYDHDLLIRNGGR